LTFCLTGFCHRRLVQDTRGPPKASKAERLNSGGRFFYKPDMPFLSPNQQCQSTEGLLSVH